MYKNKNTLNKNNVIEIPLDKLKREIVMKIEIDDEKIKNVLKMEIVPQWMKDFFAFRVTLFTIIAKFIFFLIVLAEIIAGLVLIFNEGPKINILRGLFSIFIAPIVTHIIFEFFLLLWEMLDTQHAINRELKAIRAELEKKN